MPSNTNAVVAVVNAPFTVADLPALPFAISFAPNVGSDVVPASSLILKPELPSSSVIVAVPSKLIPVTTPVSPTPSPLNAKKPAAAFVCASPLNVSWFVPEPEKY